MSTLAELCVQKCLEYKIITYDNRNMKIGTFYPHFIFNYLKDDMKYYDEQYCIERFHLGLLYFVDIPKSRRTERICQAFVEIHPELIQLIDNPSVETVITAVRKNASMIRHVQNQTQEMKLRTVAKSGMALRYINGQNEEICRVAVSRSGKALQFVQPQFKTLEICILAVRRTPHALRFVPPEFLDFCRSIWE